ncbi:hypothetical protein LPW36_02020 [Jinshanibacter sp. LJY008]|uniref:Helix-turn-helix domain-containing protein n=1 Tax=Limnobaculum eriocheiris TaxID=2897391 RepID=A0A9X1SJF9_9GAMM|nr:hypothetical protein [Limnobaculum eriocheiris]MCD1124821.1 hypothetical protein [Limnobaculum eriocheiris]
MARPPLNIDLVQVKDLASRGLTDEQIALALGISISTITRRKKDNDEFCAAIKKGKALGIATVANALFKNATEGNTTAQIFFLKNRDPNNWNDRQQVEHTGKDGGAIQVNYTPADYKAAAKKIDDILDDDD